MGFIERTRRSFEHWYERRGYFIVKAAHLEALSRRVDHDGFLDSLDQEALAVAVVALQQEATQCEVRVSALNAVMLKCERGELCERCGIQKSPQAVCGCPS